MKRNIVFDIARLLFATLVLLAHAFELTDGNRSEELFARLSRTQLTFGVLAVDGFFLLSGYLIVQSWRRKPVLSVFLTKRFLRIAPGYYVAAILSTICIGLLAPAVPHFFSQLKLPFYLSILFMRDPRTPPVLPGMKYPEVNSSLWTIAYEALCYVLVAIFGVLHLLELRAVWLVMTLGLACCFPFTEATFIRLGLCFAVGGTYELYKDKIPLKMAAGLAAFAIVLLVIALHLPDLEEWMVLVGSYGIFALSAEIGGRTSGSRITFPDISYGVYLYGWPVESLLIYYWHLSPWLIFLLAVIGSYLFGWLSWELVESRALRFSKGRREKPQPVPVAW